MAAKWTNWIERDQHKDIPNAMALNVGFIQPGEPAGFGPGNDVGVISWMSEPTKQEYEDDYSEDGLKTTTLSTHMAILNGILSFSGQRFCIDWKDDWNKNPEVLNEDFIGRIPWDKQLQASMLNLVQERGGAPSYLTREWVTGWTTYDKTFRERPFWLVDTAFVLTAAETSFLLSKTQLVGTSHLTWIRRLLQAEFDTGRLVLNRYAHFNPWYFYVYLQGRGEAVHKGLSLIHWILMEYFYKFMTPHERQQSIPPLPPVHPAGFRPMIITVHWDPNMTAIAVNKGFCSICFKNTHVAGRGSCHHALKRLKQQQRNGQL